jgi:hypothetical protein
VVTGAFTTHPLVYEVQTFEGNLGYVIITDDERIWLHPDDAELVYRKLASLLGHE